MNRKKFPAFRRCGARNRKGNPCQAPAMRGKVRCRLHGGKSKAGMDHGRYNHGNHTRQAKEQRRQITALLKQTRKFLRDV